MHAPDPGIGSCNIFKFPTHTYLGDVVAGGRLKESVLVALRGSVGDVDRPWDHREKKKNITKKIRLTKKLVQFENFEFLKIPKKSAPPI